MVVLPLVPVMPIVRSLVAGWPCTPAANHPIARRTSRTTTWATSNGSGRSTSSAAAPASTAAPAKSWPSKWSPTTHANAQPGLHLPRVVRDVDDRCRVLDADHVEQLVRR